MRVEDSQLKSFILDGGLVPSEEIAAAEKEASAGKKRLSDVILAKKLLSEEELLKLQAYILGIPFINLEGTEVSIDVLHIIPEAIARKNNIIAFRKDKGNLEVAMMDPEDLQTIDFIRRKAHLKILPRLTTTASIKHLLLQYQKSLEAEFGDIIKEESGGVRASAEVAGGGEEGDLKQAAEELPIVRIVDTLLKHAVLQGASDIHIEPQEKEVVVRYRIDGILHDAMTLPKQVHSGVVARIKILSNLKIDEHRLPQDGRFKLETDDFKYSLRVSILPVFDGEKIVMRLLAESSKALTLEELGFQGDALDRLYESMRKPVGMILVTGPTGSGKTTTLYSMMEILNTPNVNISTVEDPVEYRMPRVNQTQIRPEIGLTFANGLRSLVRQDPNIIMVGEIRDKETADLAINAALTGHLVLSTLHTNSAPGALPRLIDMGVEPFLIASTVNIIIAQRLVRRLTPEHERYHLTAEEAKHFGSSAFDQAEMLKIFQSRKIPGSEKGFAGIEFGKPKPTAESPDGYKGRLGIYEVLPVTETIRRLIVEKVSTDDILRQAKSEGMITMVEDGMVKAAQGSTSVEEVLRVITE